MSALRRAWAAWDRFWFRAVDARAVGLLRLLLGVGLVVTYGALYPELPFLVGPDAPLYQPNEPLRLLEFSVYDYTTPATLPWVHAGVLGVFALFSLGVGGRVTNLLALLGLVSLHYANPWYLHGGDRLLRLLTFMLLFVPNTRALSVDAWWARRRGRPLPGTVPVIAFRLIQLQICWMYFNTGWLKAPGGAWADGTATYYALSIEKLQRFPTLTPDLLGWAPFVYFTAAMTWVTLVWELAFPLLVLWKPTRYLALGVGVVVHVGIAMTLMLTPFSYAALVSYVAFLPAGAVGAKLGAWFGVTGGHPAAGAGAADAPGAAEPSAAG